MERDNLYTVDISIHMKQIQTQRYTVQQQRSKARRSRARSSAHSGKICAIANCPLTSRSHRKKLRAHQLFLREKKNFSKLTWGIRVEALPDKIERNGLFHCIQNRQISLKEAVSTGAPHSFSRKTQKTEIFGTRGRPLAHVRAHKK